MLNRILTDLNSLDYDVNYLLHEKLDIDTDATRITLNGELTDWLKKYAGEYEYCIFIAPEDELIQYKITKILSNLGVKIIGPGTTTSYICSSKSRTYDHLKDVKMIPTLKVNLDDLREAYDFINQYEECIVKPDDRTSSDYVFKIRSFKDLEDKLKILNDNGIYDILLQEFINGTAISASILCSQNSFNMLSVNLQKIKTTNNNITYDGCITPINHPLHENIKEVSENIIKQFNDIRGFIGIDYIISKNDLYLVEVNSRFTTPYIVLSEKTMENLTEVVINTILEDKKHNITILESGEFNKNVIL